MKEYLLFISKLSYNRRLLQYEIFILHLLTAINNTENKRKKDSSLNKSQIYIMHFKERFSGTRTRLCRAHIIQTLKMGGNEEETNERKKKTPKYDDPEATSSQFLLKRTAAAAAAA